MDNIKNGIDIFEKIEYYWEKKRGIILLNITLIYSYLQYLFPVLSKALPVYTNIFYGLSAFPVTIVTLYWFFKTNRLYLPNKKFILGLIIRVDENNAEIHLKKIVEACVEEIKSEFPDIKIILYPINYKKTEKEIQRHIRLRLLPIDGFIVATAESGNVVIEGQTTTKIQLSKFFFAGNFDVNENLNIFNSTLSINKDLSLRFFYKDWSFVENSSLTDKKKIKLNLKDTLLHFSGIYLIYKQELEIALNVLKALYEPELSKVKLKGDKVYLTKEQIAAFRLNHIILNLYLKTAINDYYISKCADKAYSLLLECNRTFPNHPDSYDHLIPLANFAYQCDDIDNAKLFTEQAKELKGETFDILLNKGFFAILDNDLDKLKHYYFRISRTNITHDYYITGVIDFFEEQRDRLNDRLILIDFAQAILTKLFLEIEFGNKLLDEFLISAAESEEFAPLVSLCEDIRGNQHLKIVMIQKRKPIGNKKRKLKRKRR